MEEDHPLEGMPLVRVSVAAHFTGLTESTIKRWIKEGKVPVYGRGRIYRLNLVDLLPRRRGDIKRNGPVGQVRDYRTGRFFTAKTPVDTLSESQEHGAEPAIANARRDAKNTQEQK
jgi:excisionase family DNA binding protein